MFRRVTHLVAAVTACAPALAQPLLEIPSGFESRRVFTLDASLPFERQVGGLEYGPNGERLIYENDEIRSTLDDVNTVIARFEPPVFGSFLRLAPDADSVYFGESSGHRIFRVPLAGGDPVLVDRLFLNFDLAFAPHTADAALAGRGFVVGYGESQSSSVWLLDEDPDDANDEIIASISRFSGPLAFDPAGNLYVITSGRSDPATGRPSEVLVRFSALQLQSVIGDGALSLGDGEELADGLDGLFNLEWLDGKLYGTNLGFGAAPPGLEAFDPDTSFTRRVFATVSVDGVPATTSLLAVRPGIEAFAEGNGRRGGSLMIAYSNFTNTSAVDEATPELHFLRGDVDDNGELGITDSITTLNWLFLGTPTPSVLEASDINGDGDNDVTDPIYLLDYLFRGGSEPPAPFPDRGPVPGP